jgi:hypothetical protein
MNKPPTTAKLSLKSLVLCNLLMLEHSIVMVEDYQFVLASQVTLVTSLIVWIVAKRKISVGLLCLLVFVVSVAWKWILMVWFFHVFYVFF